VAPLAPLGGRRQDPRVAGAKRRAPEPSPAARRRRPRRRAGDGSGEDGRVDAERVGDQHDGERDPTHLGAPKERNFQYGREGQ